MKYSLLPPFGIAIALTLMIVSVKLGLSSWAVVALLIVVMGLNLLSIEDFTRMKYISKIPPAPLIKGGKG